MLGSFRVKGDVGCTSFGKIRDDAINRLHHQMHIDRGGHAMLAQRFTTKGPIVRLGT